MEIPERNDLAKKMDLTFESIHSERI